MTQVDYVAKVKSLEYSEERPRAVVLPDTPWTHEVSSGDLYQPAFDQAPGEGCAIYLLTLVYHKVRYPKGANVDTWADAFKAVRDDLYWMAFAKDVSRGRRVLSYELASNPKDDKCVSEEIKDARNYVIINYGVRDRVWEQPEQRKSRPADQWGQSRQASPQLRAPRKIPQPQPLPSSTETLPLLF